MSNKQNITSEDGATSGFLTSDSNIRLGVGGLMSEKFSNINPIYGSDSSRFRLYTAVRYGKMFILKGVGHRYVNDSLCQALLAKEFELGITLDHPNIRRTIGFENIDGIGNVIVLEFIDGVSLGDALEKRLLRDEDIWRILREIADTLDYLENRQILHRDIKPANILLTHSGFHVKLIDFSHADSESYVMLKDAAGTNRYIAPELLDGSASPSVKSDMYSFGMVAGDLARYSGNDSLSEIARKCCASDPEARPDSFPAAIKLSGLSSIRSMARRLSRSLYLTVFLLLALLAIWFYILKFLL